MTTEASRQRRQPRLIRGLPVESHDDFQKPQCAAPLEKDYVPISRTALPQAAIALRGKPLDLGVAAAYCKVMESKNFSVSMATA